MAETSDARQILDRMIGDDAELRAMIDQEVIQSQVARLIYDARTSAGLTRKELAKLVGTRASVIVGLEEADFKGDSLIMVQRIAAAIHQRVEIRLVPVTVDSSSPPVSS